MGSARGSYIALFVFAAMILFVVLNACDHSRVPRFPTVQEITETESYNSIVEFPMHLYIADPFSAAETDMMQKALDDWRKATKGVFEVYLEHGWVPPYPFDTCYEYYDKKTLWRKNIHNQEMARLVVLHGFFDGNVKGNMMVFDANTVTLEDNMLYIVMKHEIGHMIGLGHLKRRFTGVMNIGGNQGVFTRNDMILFCSKYECLPDTVE